MRRAIVILLFLVAAVLILQHLTAPNVPRPTAIDARYLCAYPSTPAPVAELTCADCTYAPLDKAHRLPPSYAPIVVPTFLAGGGWLVPPAQSALTDLFAEARKRGLSPSVTSAYRSYPDQKQTFATWFRQELGHTNNLDRAFDNATRYSALPGFSEHQLGTAVDLNCNGCTPFDDQDDRNVALWRFLENDVYRFGFVISYPRNVEPLTGYMYEPWHIRFVGVDFATALYAQGYVTGNGVCLSAFLRAQASS